jgi:hypothetical protein
MWDMMGGMHWGMALVSILVLALLVLGISSAREIRVLEVTLALIYPIDHLIGNVGGTARPRALAVLRFITRCLHWQVHVGLSRSRDVSMGCSLRRSAAVSKRVRARSQIR